jgi:hypothetical protein
MNNKLNVALALFTGLAGGMLTRYIAPQPAFAQAQAPTKEIRAQTFTLVDPSDRTVGTFSVEGGPVVYGVGPDGKTYQRGPNLGDPRNAVRQRIVLRDATGQEIWSAGGSPIRALSQR